MKIVLLLGSLLFLVGCGQNTVYVKCQLPEVPKADLEVINPDDPSTVKLQKIMNNCLKIKHENEILREAMKLCQ